MGGEVEKVCPIAAQQEEQGKMIETSIDECVRFQNSRNYQYQKDQQISKYI